MRTPKSVPYTQQEANGVYAVIQMEIGEQADETLDMSLNHLTLVNDQDRAFDTRPSLNVAVDSDPQIDVEGFVYEQFNPGLTTSGVAVFDLNPGAEYSSQVEPVGYFSDADTHLVTLGTIEAYSPTPSSSSLSSSASESWSSGGRGLTVEMSGTSSLPGG